MKKIIRYIREKIALRRERKAKLRRLADVIAFATLNGREYIDLNIDLVGRKSVQACGIGPAGLSYIWKDKHGNIVVDGNIMIHGGISSSEGITVNTRLPDVNEGR